MASKGWFNLETAGVGSKSHSMTRSPCLKPTELPKRSRKPHTLRETLRSNSSVFRGRRDFMVSSAGTSLALFVSCERPYELWLLFSLMCSLAIGFLLSLLGSIVLFLGQVSIFASERSMLL